MRFSMDSILQGTPSRTEISPRKRAHSSTADPPIESVKSNPNNDVPVAKKPKLIENGSTPSKKETTSKIKEVTKHVELDPLASLAAFERPSTSSSSSLASLDDEDELDKRLVSSKTG